MKKYLIAQIIGCSGRFIHCLMLLLLAFAVLGPDRRLPDAQFVFDCARPARHQCPGNHHFAGGRCAENFLSGQPDLNTTQPIRRDGMISMPLIGEVKAAGKTPKQLEADLADAFSTQLLSKEVTVEVQSSTFPVYVSGSVLRPGKVVSDQPMTALEAIMEAGGPDYAKADLKHVAVVRQEGDHSQKFTLNLKLVMDGKGGEPFYLKPGDTMWVPEKFTWF